MSYTNYTFKNSCARTIEGWLHKKRKMDIGYNYSTPDLKKDEMDLTEYNKLIRSILDNNEPFEYK